MRMRWFLISSLVAGIMLLGPAAGAYAEMPQSVDAFRDSVGVNTHLGYFDTAYSNIGVVVARLQELGVTHLRDLIVDNGVAPFMQAWNKNVQMATAAGMKFDFVMPAPSAGLGTIAGLTAELGGSLRNAAEAIEAPNEFDLVSGNPSWPETLGAYDKQLYQTMRLTPALQDVPVIGSVSPRTPATKPWATKARGSTTEISTHTPLTRRRRPISTALCLKNRQSPAAKR